MALQHSFGHTARKFIIACSLWMAVAVCVGPKTLDAQEIVPPPSNQQRTISGFPPSSSTPLVQPLPPQPEAVAPFIEGLTVNDALVEIIVGQGRILTTKEEIAFGKNSLALIALGDPNVAEFTIADERHIRITGLQIGATDLAVTTTSGKSYSFEIQVVPDVDILRARLRATFTDAEIEVRQIRDQLIVEGEARSTQQVSQIIQMIQGYLESVQTASRFGKGTQTASLSASSGATGTQDSGVQASFIQNSMLSRAQFQRQLSGIGDSEQGDVATGSTSIINLLRVKGPQQVLLKVRIAELNRTALREAGNDFLAVDPATGNIFGTQIAGGLVEGLGVLGAGGLTGVASGQTGTATTAFGIFPSGDFELLVRLLRRNSMLKIHAEPNLVTLTGQEASFLVGGEFPVPVPQIAGGVANAITVQFKEFGTRLSFLPYILDDDVIRLTVAPEVSSIDRTLGTTLVLGGEPIPGLNTRKAFTTVELRESQTLALAGLLQQTMDGQTARIPFIGDIPYIGVLFSNNSSRQIETEMLVLVTPYLVEPMEADEVPALPGDEVYDPNDCEFFLMGRIEGRTGQEFRATTRWDDRFCPDKRRAIECKHVQGIYGFSE